MNTEENGILERLASLSIERCLVKLSKVSAGTWKLAGVSGSRGMVEAAVGQYDFRGRAAAAVYMDINGDAPLFSMMLFEPEDMDCISKCFMGYSFPRTQSISMSEEVMLLELGNIILNSLTNSVLNALRRSIMPSTPQFIAGAQSAIVAGLGARMDLKQNFRIVTVSLVMQSGNVSSSSTVFVLIPEELAQELEGMVS